MMFKKQSLIFLMMAVMCLMCMPMMGIAQTQQNDTKADYAGIVQYLQKAMNFNTAIPQEKVYVHFDNTGYFENETMWFKAYVTRTDKMSPTDLSKVLYVELLNPSGDVLKTQKVPIDEHGQAFGDMKLDTLFGTGFYEVRAYTRYMTNWGVNALFSRVFPIFKAPKEEGNYMKLTEAITSANAVDIAKEVLFSLDPHLRAQTCYMYCSQDFADKYNEGYLLTHAGINYNNQYNQTAVEGSNGKLILCPLANKADSKFIHVSPKINMLVGYDQMGDTENVMVKEYEPFILSYIATMFFGTQFESIDKRRLKVVELASPVEP